MKIGLRTLRRFCLWSLVFSMTFILIGELSIDYVSNEITKADYYYTISIKDPQLKVSYVEELKKIEPQHDIQVYAVYYEQLSAKGAKYTVYAPPRIEEDLKERTRLQKDNNTLNSILGKQLIVEYCPFDKLTEAKKQVTYYAFGSEENMRLFRSATIDKYGMSKPEDATYDSKKDEWVLLIWTIVILTYSIAYSFQTHMKKKEVLLRYINGYDIYLLIAGILIRENIILIGSFTLSFCTSLRMNTPNLFFDFSLIAIIIMIVITSVESLLYAKMDYKRIIGAAKYSALLNTLINIVLICTIIFSVGCLSININKAIDAKKTLEQKTLWEKYDDYNVIYFTFKHWSDKANFELDEKYVVDFYNKFLDRYKIELFCDLNNNGSTVSYFDKEIVYANKYALGNLSMIGVDEEELKRNKYTIILPDDLESLNYVNNKGKILGISVSDCKKIIMKENYEVLVNDIQIENLSQNYKSNPIIIADATNSWPDNEFGNSIIFTALIDFTEENDFIKFIETVGYEDEIFYQNSVKELYSKKLLEKKYQLALAFASLILFLSFFFVIYSLSLKIYFEINKKEIILKRVLGASIFERYRSYIMRNGVALLFVDMIGIMICSITESLYLESLLEGMCIINVSSVVLFIKFVMKCEKNNISNVLKGGN